ncbi:hypothetical protein CR513_07086, partial [Mucuna pruriens]
MTRAACLMVAAAPRTLTATVLSNSFRSKSSMVDKEPAMPALLNKTSRLPYLSTKKKKLYLCLDIDNMAPPLLDVLPKL